MGAILITPTIAFGSPKNDFSQYSIISKRNVFRPLWVVPSSGRSDERSRKEELEALRKAELERQDAQKTAEEQNTLNNKKREFEQNYTLNGIVFENGRRQAVVQDKKGLTYFLYENDTLDDAKIISISDSKSEIVADYQGKFTVTLHMQ
ncbi:MAG: hypothetical protein A2293_10310 [Elusimicrobia bacterium RIFOXYB2_FULL_49_7]|nr:MAG: hypothetical protein A2293_10310 [Elusimicrobia bacterium RIFOXYB2_FULL_49_7]